MRKEGGERGEKGAQSRGERIKQIERVVKRCHCNAPIRTTLWSF